MNEQDIENLKKIRKMMLKATEDLVKAGVKNNRLGRDRMKAEMMAVFEQAIDEGLVHHTEKPKFEFVQSEAYPSKLDIIPLDDKAKELFEMMTKLSRPDNSMKVDE